MSAPTEAELVESINVAIKRLDMLTTRIAALIARCRTAGINVDLLEQRTHDMQWVRISLKQAMGDTHDHFYTETTR